MNFRVKVSSEKTEAFLQLMRVWQKLGLVEDVQTEAAVEEEGYELQQQQPASSREMAGQYRDLVD